MFVAFCRVAPSVRLRVFAIFASGSLRAMLLSNRKSSFDHARRAGVFLARAAAFAMFGSFRWTAGTYYQWEVTYVRATFKQRDERRRTIGQNLPTYGGPTERPCLEERGRFRGRRDGSNAAARDRRHPSRRLITQAHQEEDDRVSVLAPIAFGSKTMLRSRALMLSQPPSASARSISRR
jgi:hypothetical protein